MVQNAKPRRRQALVCVSAAALDAFWHDDGIGFDVRCHASRNLPVGVVERFVNEAGAGCHRVLT
jgi:hypothetical protein